jgi:hypothetical protein
LDRHTSLIAEDLILQALRGEMPIKESQVPLIDIIPLSFQPARSKTVNGGTK